MENQTTPKNINKVVFIGKGSELFAIDLLNTIFIVLTLGLYYPWAKAKKLKYVYQHLYLSASPFDFLGTGKEIFRGFIKALGIIILFYGIFFLYEYLVSFPQDSNLLLIITGILTFLVIFLGLPYFSAYAIYGTFRYRSARSTWRGILFGYRITKPEFVSVYLKAYYYQILPLVGFGLILGFFTAMLKNEFDEFTLVIIILLSVIPILVFFLYTYSYYLTKLYSITYGRMSLGDIDASFDGKAGELFKINLKGLLLTGLTLGIYSFWYKKNLYNYLIQSLWLKQDDTNYRCTSNIKATDVFELVFINNILMGATFGLAYSWTYVRNIEFITKKIILPSELDLDRINQTHQYSSNATAEEMGDLMDVDMGGIFF